MQKMTCELVPGDVWSFGDEGALIISIMKSSKKTKFMYRVFYLAYDTVYNFDSKGSDKWSLKS
jgi:hypothetical protein